MRTATAICKSCKKGSPINQLQTGVTLATIHHSGDVSIVVPHDTTCVLFNADLVALQAGVEASRPGSSFWLPSD
jgi:hypothetical protein